MILSRIFSPNLIKAGVASGWVLGGRVMGLLWTALLIFSLGLGDYGAYAIAYAISAIIAAPLDNIFLVRSLRVSDETFRSERATRVWVGAALLIVGCAVFLPSFIVGFAFIVAGGEILFNSVKSSFLRDGHPNVVMRYDAIRQAASVAIAAAYLFTVPDPRLEMTVALYSIPYVVVLVMAILQARGSRAAVPGSLREMLLLWFDAMALALYLQGDVLLLGILTNDEVAGAYSLASVVALAASAFAQMFVHTYHERLRSAGGNPGAGPKPAITVVISLLLGGAVLVVGLVAMALGNQENVGAVLVTMSFFVVLRSTSLVLTTILYVQHRDGHRVAAGWIAGAVKLGLLTLLAFAGLGALGAAFASIAAELVLVIWYSRVVYSWAPELSLTPPEKTEEPSRVLPPFVEGWPR